MAAAAEKLLKMTTTMSPDMMPDLEQKSMTLANRVQQEEERVAKIEADIDAGKARLEELLQGRLNLGSPRSHLRGVGSNAVFKEMLKYYRKRIRILEVDRDRAIKHHDRIKAHNEEVRRKINELRKDAVLQNRQFEAQRVKLLEVKDLMARDLKNANDILAFNDDCKESIEILKEEDAQEQEDFERECQALSTYVSERLERLAFIEKGEDLTDLAKLTPEESKRMDQQMEEIHKTMAANADKDAASNENLQEYQVAFNQLKRVTGINDIRKMVSSFIEIEDRNFGMFRYIQLVNKDLKKEQAALDKVQSDVREFTEMNREAHEAKKKAMERRQRDAQRLLKDNDTYQRKYKELKKQFEQVSAAVKRTFVAIGCAELADDRPASTRSSRSSRPPHNFRRPPPSPIQRPGTVPARLSERPDSAGSVRSSAHEVQELVKEEVSEGNILKFVGVIEQRVLDVCAATRKRLLAEAAAEEEAAKAEAEKDGAGSTAGESAVAKLPPVVHQVMGPKEPPKAHQFHIILPDIHDDDDDKLDLAASLPNPITNAMEASMTHLKLDNKDWGDDGTGVGLANLLSDATAAEDTRTPVSTRTRRRRRPSNSNVTLVRVEELAKEIEAQFQGPEGLAVSQFIKPGRAAKPEAKKGKGPLRRKKRHASSLAAHPLSSSTTDLGFRGAPKKGMRHSKSAVGRHRGAGGQVRFSSTIR